MWVSQLIQTYLIDNPHRVRLTLVPDAMQSENEKHAEQARLNEIAQQLTPEARLEIKANTAALEERQATPDNLDLLPKVTLEDVPADLKLIPVIAENIHIDGQATPVNLYHAGTNGLFYQQVLVHLPQQLVHSPYFGLLSMMMGEVGAGQDDYLSLQDQQTAISGGVGMGLSLRSKLDDHNQISALLTLTTKALNRHPEAMDLLHKAFTSIRFDEKKRILELLQQRKASWQSRLSGSGHSYAMQTASRNMSALALRDYYNTGLPALRWLNNLIDSITQNEERYNQFIAQLIALKNQILKAPKEFLLVCTPDQSDDLLLHLQKVWATAPIIEKTYELDIPEFEKLDQDEAWLIQTNVHFCASAYPAVNILHPDAAAFMVLGSYLRNGYLHSAIREKGGAYGGGAGYDANACAFRFYSYRDPRLTETFNDFTASIEWLLNTEQHEYQLEEAILGLVGSMDKPGSPAGEAITTCYGNLHGRTHEFRQDLRQRLLQVKINDLQYIVRNYLLHSKPVRAVVAPFNKAEELQALGFHIQRIE